MRTISQYTTESIQTDVLEHVFDLGQFTFKINVHRDKSYRSQARSQLRVWTEGGWEIISTGGNDRTHENTVEDTATYFTEVAERWRP